MDCQTVQLVCYSPSADASDKDRTCSTIHSGARNKSESKLVLLMTEETHNRYIIIVDMLNMGDEVWQTYPGTQTSPNDVCHAACTWHKIPLLKAV